MGNHPCGTNTVMNWTFHATGEALLGGFRIVTPKWTPFWGPHYRPGSLERWVAKTQGPAGWPAQSHAAESQRSKECNQAQEPFGQGAAQISEGESFQFTARAHFCANSATFNPILLIVRFSVSPLVCVHWCIKFEIRSLVVWCVVVPFFELRCLIICF